MKNTMTSVIGMAATAILMFAAVPGAAADIDVRIEIQPRPWYVPAQYESDWRARQLRAIQWRDNPNNHGKAVSAAAHQRNAARKAGHNGKK